MQNHVLDYLDNIVRIKPDKIAFADEKEALTFKQVYDQSRSIGTFLHTKGICRPRFSESSRAETFMSLLTKKCQEAESS